MSSRRSSNALPSPLALTLRLSPGPARLLVVATALVLTWLVMALFSEQTKILEERVGAEAWKIGADSAPEQRVTLIAIDEKSLARLGPWPWPRDTMADLSMALQQAGAQMQIYDIVFPESRAGDERFVAALESGNAVLGQVPVMGAQQTLQAGTLTHGLVQRASGINCSAAPSTQNYLANHAGFASLPKGHITPRVASDGGVRHIPALICVDGNAYPTLAISALLTAAGASPAGVDNTGGWSASLSQGQSWLDPAFLLEMDAYPGLAIPLDANGDMRIPFDRLPESYRAISAVDVLNGDYDAAMLDNTWALIGATAFGLGDIVPTPYSGTAPGVELQARIIGSLLDANVPYTPRSAALLLFLLSAASAAILLVLASFRQRLAMFGLPIAALLLPAAALGLHIYLLGAASLWLGWLAPALFTVLAASLLLLLEHGRVRMEHNRVYGNLNSYLPADVARDIAYNLPTSDIDARRLELTLLSADLRNFSAYTEARPPEESAALLHCFFMLATDIIERNDGRVHEFKGDGLLAAWSGDQRGAEQALKASEEMQVAIQRDLLPKNPPGGLEPLGLGIGIEQGSVLMGSIGPAQRRTHALLGDTVAITFRIQEMTTELALPILVGEAAAAQLQSFDLQSQGRYLLSGLKVPHTLYSPAIPESERPDQFRAGSPDLKVVTGGRSS